MAGIDFTDRLEFHTDSHVMEVDFSNFIFKVPNDVHKVYDEVERQLKSRGKKWFFLVNYHQCKIMSEAWIAFAHRGKIVNIAYSLGSARFAAGSDTEGEILERSREEKFDPNLFSSREAALDYLAGLRSDIPENELKDRLKPLPPNDPTAFGDRIAFHQEMQVMEVDFSNISFATSSDVNSVYDEITDQIAQTQQSWYFIVNYANTEILPEAWYTWSERGKKLNQQFSLGTVRFDPREETRQKILKRARADEFNPNLVANREDALKRVEEMKQK